MRVVNKTKIFKSMVTKVRNDNFPPSTHPVDNDQVGLTHRSKVTHCFQENNRNRGIHGLQTYGRHMEM